MADDNLVIDNPGLFGTWFLGSLEIRPSDYQPHQAVRSFPIHYVPRRIS